MIDKTSVIPLYYQLAETLKSEISKGSYGDANMLHSERVLCEKYGLSRATVRQAIQLLKEEGLIEKQRGVGTRVVSKDKFEQDLLGYHDFDLQMVEKGYKAEVKLVSFNTQIPPDRILKLLNLSKGDKTLVIDRVRMIEDVPLFIERLYFPEQYGKNLSPDDFISTRIFSEILNKKCSITLGEAHIYIEPIILDEQEANQLLVETSPSPGLLFERISFTDKKKPICITKRIFRGDRCRHLLTIKPK